MRVHLIHGFNVSDGGRGSIGNLQSALRAASLTPVLHDYGWTGPLRLRLRNRSVVRKLLAEIEPGEAVAAHSNGALICRRLVLEDPHRLSAAVLIQPCVRRDLIWPAQLRLLCLHNPYDYAVQLGRMWGRLSTLVTPFSPHGWGAAGYYGFSVDQDNVTSWDTSANYWSVPARGHSTALRPPAVDYWGRLVAAWLSEQRRRAAWAPPGSVPAHA